MRRFRLPVAALLGLCVLAAAMLAAESAQTETTAAVRAVTQVAAGEVLTAEKLETVEVDVAAVPGAHLGEMDDYLGRTAAAAMPEGSVVLTTQLVGPGLLAGYEPGTVAVPVRPADPSMIAVLSAGQRVDVTASSEAAEDESGAVRLAQAAPVLWIPQNESENWLGANQQSGQVVIIAVDSQTAASIAEAGHQGRLHLSLVSADSDQID